MSCTRRLCGVLHYVGAGRRDVEHVNVAARMSVVFDRCYIGGVSGVSGVSGGAYIHV